MIKSFALAVVLLLGLAGSAHAQSDPLAKCLADNTTGKDRKALARWMFVSMSAHPELRDLALNSEGSIEQTDKTMAAIVTRLLIENCTSEVQAVVRTGEGEQTMRRAFESLGRLAMLELMSNGDVAASVSRFGRYVDQAKISAVLRGQ